MSNIYAAIIAAQGEFGALPKTGTNPHFKNKFVPLHEVMQAIIPVLSKHGLALLQFPSNIDGAPALRSVLVHESGEHVEATMPLLAAKDDPQGQGSALTYARRYAAMSILGLVGDEDDDAEATRVSSTTKPDLSNSTRKRVYQKADQMHAPDNVKEYGIPDGHAARNESARVISSAVAKRNLLGAASAIIEDEAVAKGVAAGVWQDSAKGLSTVGSSKLDEMIEETKLRAAAINLGAELET